MAILTFIMVVLVRKKQTNRPLKPFKYPDFQNERPKSKNTHLYEQHSRGGEGVRKSVLSVHQKLEATSSQAPIKFQVSQS